MLEDDLPWIFSLFSHTPVGSFDDEQAAKINATAIIDNSYFIINIYIIKVYK